jgi:hypothetical protein
MPARIVHAAFCLLLSGCCSQNDATADAAEGGASDSGVGDSAPTLDSTTTEDAAGPVPGVTVGHSHGEIRVTEPGSQAAIKDALKTYNVVALYADGDYEFTGELMFPETDQTYKLIGTGGRPRIVPHASYSSSSTALIRNYWQGGNLQVENLEFDLQGRDLCAVAAHRGCWSRVVIRDLKIHNARYEGMPRSQSGGVLGAAAILVSYARDTYSQVGTTGEFEVSANEIYDYENIAIRAQGIESSPRTVSEIFNNHIHDCPIYDSSGGQPAKIWADKASIHDNTIYNCKYEDPLTDYRNSGSAYAEYGAVGISAAFSEIADNTIIAMGRGIVPGERSFVYQNVIRFCALGIDFWRSDYCVIEGNEIYDNSVWGPYTSWDSVGIDVADHTSRATIISNDIGNRSEHMEALLTEDAAAGQSWIAVDSMDGHQGLHDWSPNQWIEVQGESQQYMINNIDKVQQVIHLLRPLAADHSAGEAITGVNTQGWGVGIGDNLTWWDPGEERGWHFCHGNTYHALLLGEEGEPGVGWPLQPHSYFENHRYKISNPNDEAQLGCVPTAALGKNITLAGDGGVWRYDGVADGGSCTWTRQ